MLKTYAGVWHNGQIEWKGEPPPQTEGPLDVQVTVLQPSATTLSPEERRRGAAEALERLAAMNAFADIIDPVAWQREIRKDRPLPGRE
jgi:hypothetical protein